MASKAKGREIRIDIMRSLGTLLVILAHIEIPNSLLQLRCFDVITLVFISGYCISANSSWPKYFKKRFFRLVIPTWEAITVLFVLTYVACIILGRPQIYTPEKIIRSYLFINGSIGYIWIVRVYVVIALVTPLIISIDKQIKNDLIYYAIVAVGFLLSILVNSTLLEHELAYYATEALAYSSIAALGYRFKQKNNFMAQITLLAGAVTFVVVMYIKTSAFTPDLYKYPPQTFYIAYGISITMILFLLLRNVRNAGKSSRVENAVMRFSTLSFDIYLFHIIFISVLNLVLDRIGHPIPWIIQYIFIIIISTSCSIIFDRLRVSLKQLKTKRNAV